MKDLFRVLLYIVMFCAGYGIVFYNTQLELLSVAAGVILGFSTVIPTLDK